MNTDNQINCRLLFDKIAFTMAIEDDKKMPLLDTINNEYFFSKYERKVYSDSNGRYKNNYQFTIHNNNTIEVSLYPKNKRHNFFRIEFNPDKLGKEGLIKLRRFLIKLLGKIVVRNIYYHASITRLDLTLDVDNLLKQPYIYRPKAIKSDIYRNDRGSVLSQVVGSERSACMITMYDKDIEQNIKGYSSPLKNTKRIEIRLRDLKSTMYSLNDSLMKQLHNIYFFNSDFLYDKSFNEYFLSNIEACGVNHALNNLHNSKLRRQYLNKLKAYRLVLIDLNQLNFYSTKAKYMKGFIHKKYSSEILKKAA